MKVSEIEARIFELEEIVVVIRAPADEDVVHDYDYVRKSAGNISLSTWLETRLIPKIGDREFRVINGNYSTPHGRTTLSTLRASYEN